MRAALCFCAALLLGSCSTANQPIPELHQATGVKIGEVTPTSAIIWARLTERPERRSDGVLMKGRSEEEGPPKGPPDESVDTRELEGSAPGSSGRLSIAYSTQEDLSGAKETEWKDAVADHDYAAQFEINSLEPSTKYYFESRSEGPDGRHHLPLRGSFTTAPPPGEFADVLFNVITCQAYRDTDDPGGFKIYESMLENDPDFMVPTGDTVYYDSDEPIATSIELARYHWRRMYSLPLLKEFHRQVPAYWEKDDHDSYANDDWPGAVRDYMGSFSFDQGLKVYAEQVPIGDVPYRRYRWGKGVEIWLTEGRDFRSPNNMPDGPEKSTWGAKQKAWLQETLLASDADWRILINPTPVVGPDRPKKNDNLANSGFHYEGEQFRKWAAENLDSNFFVVCGDRHWQYHSVDPETGVQEFSVGPASDQHAAGTPGFQPDYHRFHRVTGGFLSVHISKGGGQSKITFQHHGVDGEVVYEWSASKPADSD